jgi:C4-type Zn-finger protein
MATNCYACGYRDNEIKSGGAVSEKGRKITLKVEDEEDMSRDMLKVSFAKPVFTLKLTPSPTQQVSRFPKSILSYSPEPSVDDSQP